MALFSLPFGPIRSAYRWSIEIDTGADATLHALEVNSLDKRPFLRDLARAGLRKIVVDPARILLFKQRNKCLVEEFAGFIL